MAPGLFLFAPSSRGAEPRRGVSKDGHRPGLAAILRDASLRDAPQDEALRCIGAFHHVINGERCSQVSLRSWSRTNVATSVREIVPPWKPDTSVSARTGPPG